MSSLRASACALAWFAILACALSWPTIRYFTVPIVGRGADPLHFLWQLWHVKEAFRGSEPLFFTNLLYYPTGISLLTHGTGPVVGLLVRGLIEARGAGARLACGAALFAAVLAETWPTPWPMQVLRDPPESYQRIATDRNTYGVLDLPVADTSERWPIEYSAYYQIDQMTHRKPIAAGYISRTYATHPVFPCLYRQREEEPDLLIDGVPARCAAATRSALATHDYRYVVVRKPDTRRAAYRAGSAAEVSTSRLVAEMFGAAAPLVDDESSRVYEVGAVEAGPPVTLQFGQNWHERETERRWARSPANLIVTASVEREVTLEIVPSLVHDPTRANGSGVSGKLSIAVGATIQRRPIEFGRALTIPFEIVGWHFHR